MSSEIKKARLKAGLSQGDVVAKLHIPKQTLCNWEAGRRKCPAWAEALIVEKLIHLGKERQLKNIKDDFITYS